MKQSSKIAAALILLATPAIAQPAPSTAGGADSADPADSTNSTGADEQFSPDASGGTTGTVELPGGGTVTETRPASDQDKANGVGEHGSTVISPEAPAEPKRDSPSSSKN